MKSNNEMTFLLQDIFMLHLAFLFSHTYTIQCMIDTNINTSLNKLENKLIVLYTNNHSAFDSKLLSW